MYSQVALAIKVFCGAMRKVSPGMELAGDQQKRDTASIDNFGSIKSLLLNTLWPVLPFFHSA